MMFNEAENCYHLYTEVLERNLGPECGTVSNSYFMLGNYYFRRGRINKAHACFLQSCKIRENLKNQNFESVTHCRINSSLCLIEMSKVQESIDQLKSIE